MANNAELFVAHQLVGINLDVIGSYTTGFVLMVLFGVTGVTKALILSRNEVNEASWPSAPAHYRRKAATDQSFNKQSSDRLTKPDARRGGKINVENPPQRILLF
jgi:hypothetical protein